MAWAMDMVDTIDHGDMDTGDVRRGPLTSQLSPDLILMLMPMLMLGMVTMATAWDMDMDTGDVRRGLLTSQLSP